jgi:hypothetical protein
VRSYIGPGTQLTDPHHTGTKHEMVQIDDGRWHHRFGASWLKTFDLCPERARLEHEGYDHETDAAACGTAVHLAIQYTLEEWYASGEPYDAQTAVDLFHAEFDAMEYEHVKYKTAAPLHKFGETCVRNWYRSVLPTLPPEAQLEVTFVLPFYEDDERVIELSGGIDYVDTVLRDWKTSGRGPYEEWEYKRWAIQPTVYSWAASTLALVEPVDGVYPFEYVVLGRHGAQRFTVHRGPGDWAWLQDKVSTAARLIEAGLDEWPKQDNHALCSAKWCPAWSECKGKFLGT